LSAAYQLLKQPMPHDATSSPSPSSSVHLPCFTQNGLPCRAASRRFASRKAKRRRTGTLESLTTRSKRISCTLPLIVVQSGVNVAPAAFHLRFSDIASIREEERASRLRIQKLTEEYRRSTQPVADRIEAAVAQAETSAPVLENNPAMPQPNAIVSWRCYAKITEVHDNVMDVRRLECASQIVRANAGVFPAAACANLLADLDQQALRIMADIIDRTNNTATGIVIDPGASATIGAQLCVRGAEAGEKINRFLSRFDLLSSRTLGQLSWVASNATPDLQRQSSGSAVVENHTDITAFFKRLSQDCRSGRLQFAFD
jgi:hypothetical protein